jgi:hypothetical protein
LLARGGPPSRKPTRRLLRGPAHGMQQQHAVVHGTRHQVGVHNCCG